MAPKLWSGARAKATATKKKPAVAKETAAIKGLAGFKKASAIFSGTVDKGVYQQNPALASRAKVLPGWDARLLAINPATKDDRYYVLQGLEDPKVPLSKPKRYYAYRRWGHTGTGGVCRLQGPMEEHKVEEQLMKVFKSMTGATWGTLKAGDKARPGKYWLVLPWEADPNAVWQYLVDDGVDKKVNGWYPYDPDAIAQVEELYAEHAANTSSKNSTAKRYVASGGFTYCVDLDGSTQQNTTTRKKRSIRRVTSTASTQAATETNSLAQNASSSSSSLAASAGCSIGLARADTGPGVNRSDTADTVPALWNDAEWNARSNMLLKGLKRSSTTFSEFPGIPQKRRRQASRVDIPLDDMQSLLISGEIKKVPVAKLRTWVRSMGMVATGSKDELMQRAHALVFS